MSRTQRIESTMEVVRILVSMAIAYILALIILFAISENPVFIVQQFILGPFSSARRIGSIINLAVPFTICGVAMCFMYAVNRFNLVPEGIFMLSGCMISLAALNLPQNLPAVVMVPLLLIVGALTGAVVAFIPAIMERKFNANVVVVSLMLNSVLAFFATYILKYKMRDTSLTYIASFELPAGAQLPTLPGGLRVQSGLIIAVIVVILVSLLFYKTSYGWKMRLVGENPRFATAVGLSAVTTEVMSNYTRFRWTTTTQHGFDGLLVAVLARKNPALVPIGALFLAYIRIGADVVNSTGDIPPEFITVIQGIIILLIAAETFMAKTKNKMIFKAAKEDEKARNEKQQSQTAA